MDLASCNRALSTKGKIKGALLFDLYGPCANLRLGPIVMLDKPEKARPEDRENLRLSCHSVTDSLQCVGGSVGTMLQFRASIG